jgi:hypothetical protein
MASNDANLGALLLEAPSTPKDPWMPRAFNPEVSTRFIDVVAGLANHAGAALTFFIRFFVMFPAALCVIGGELLYRLDEVIVRKSQGVSRG